MKKRLEELLEYVQTTDLQEVMWEKKGTLISFRRHMSAPPSSHQQQVQSGAGASAAQAPGASTGSAAPAPAQEPLTIKSTMVGTFFRSDSPNRPPLVVEGTVVASGQPVAAIEAMKIMKDVLSPQACKIVKALVANGHPVEYGQPLFEVEPAQEPAGV